MTPTCPTLDAPVHAAATSKPSTPDFAHAEFRRDVCEGLNQTRKTLPCKYFYDARGSQLFDSICDLPEYYVTRTEAAIMQQHAPAMARFIGPRAALIEYGAGSSTKTRLLLNALQGELQPRAYVPLDISSQHLQQSAAQLRREYPQLNILPVVVDYTRDFGLPRIEGAARRAVYFPGSTLGNFEQAAAQRFLEHIAQVCEPGGALLIGVDLVKNVGVLEAAYNDAQNVTSDFNLNLLGRINRDLGGDFDLNHWTHRAIWNDAQHRIEMHLVSRCHQRVRIGAREFAFERGETILTELSHKYAPETFAQMTRNAGFETREVWTDERNWFSVQALVAC